MKLALCPHISESDLPIWNKVKDELEKKLGEKIELQFFQNFKEEEERIEFDVFHLYYANPYKAIILFQKGYKPVARFRGTQEYLYVIGKEEDVFERDSLKVAVPLSSLPIYGMLYFYFGEIDVVIGTKWEDVFELVRLGKADVGVIYSGVWEKIEEKDDVKVVWSSEEWVAFHVFMAHPTVYNKVKPVLLSFDFLDEVTENDILAFTSVFKKFSMLGKRWEERDIAKAVASLGNVGVIIQQDKIEYANAYACKLLGYSKDEICSGSLLDFVYDKDKEKVEKALKQILLEKLFSCSCSEVRVINKRGKILILNVFASSVLFKGRYSAFILFFDITKHKRFERLYLLLREINQAITLSTLEEELFQRICKALVEKVGLKFVWVGVKESEENPYFKILYKAGEEEGYLDEVSISWKEDHSAGQGPSGVAYRTDEIAMVSDIQREGQCGACVDSAVQRGFLSCASIPLKDRTGVVRYVLAMYAPEPDFFDEETISVLYELKSDLEFAIKRLQDLRDSVVLSRAIEDSHSWVVVTDDKFRITYVNRAVCEISGYSKEELIGQNPRIFKSGLHPPHFYEELYNAILSGRVFTGVFINKKKNGKIFHLKVTIYPVQVFEGERRFLAIGTDITQEVKFKEQMAKLKYYDSLTGLLNMDGFFLIVAKKLEEDTHWHYTKLLAQVDIRDFSVINKTFGFEMGDAVLKDIAERLKLAFPNTLVARVSADEFVIFEEVSRKKEEAGLASFLERMHYVFEKPVYLSEKLQIKVSFNAGITMAPRDGKDIKELMGNVSMALAEAKLQGENKIMVFNEEVEKKVGRIMFAKTLIERAMEEDLFVLYYQPYFNAKTLRLEGFEALVRIKDTDGTIYTPSFFIDVLENNTRLIDYEKWLLKQVAEKARKWKVDISFNVSANSFKSKEYVFYLSTINSNASLTMEITERVLMENLEEAQKVLGFIKDRTNFKIAIDDFGTGYSSLKYVTEIPVDKVKIDMSFVRRMREDLKAKVMVKTIANLAAELGIASVAEGVERSEELEMLQEFGCTYVQGYLLGKPMPEEEAERLVLKSQQEGDSQKYN
ncbi:EAL domain-containing protein [Thermosulfidibacter takaii]|uniref:EAL domain-containing protein n=1 Tax=Thermosulfidibacter takaii TaxID=412593 RepID=UPI0008389F2C|nr:EAL domain-containing protein [Thermosulfidibacter takaii]